MQSKLHTSSFVGRLGALIRAPLFQFVFAGAAAFALAAAAGQRPSMKSERRIEVTERFADGLAWLWSERNGRPPTPEEQRGLVDEFVEEEILFREATALGLDRGDLIVRRRMVQKMRFVVEDRLLVPEPTPADLAEWLAAHRDRYDAPAQVSFQHVFLREGRGDADALLGQLADAGPGAGDALGDPFGRDRRVQATQAEIARQLSSDVAEAVMTRPVGRWFGPVPSPFGQHLIYVSDRREASEANLEDPRIATRVAQDWRNAQQAELNRRALEALRASYDVQRPALESEPALAVAEGAKR